MKALLLCLSCLGTYSGLSTGILRVCLHLSAGDVLQTLSASIPRLSFVLQPGGTDNVVILFYKNIDSAVNNYENNPHCGL